MGASIRALRARCEALATPEAFAVAEAGRLRVYRSRTAATAAASAATATTAAAAASAATSLVCGRWLRAATTAVSGFGLDPLGVARGALLLAPPFPIFKADAE